MHNNNVYRVLDSDGAKYYCASSITTICDIAPLIEHANQIEELDETIYYDDYFLNHAVSSGYYLYEMCETCKTKSSIYKHYYVVSTSFLNALNCIKQKISDDVYIDSIKKISKISHIKTFKEMDDEIERMRIG